VVLVSGDTVPVTVPAGWPADRTYLALAGGYAAWEADVLTPAEPTDASVAERVRVARQRQLAAVFSGAAAQASSAAAPPPVAPAAGGGRRSEPEGAESGLRRA
jgi:hypothetical protein